MIERYLICCASLKVGERMLGYKQWQIAVGSCSFQLGCELSIALT